MNTTIQEKKTLPQLIKGSSTYKLVVPEKVEEKIRYLLRKFPSTEWSGVLFISHKGSFENGDLVITCEDLYPMDLGTSGWTEFKMSEDVAAYMAEHIELFDCDTALVHSHHALGAFLSGQDMKMVQQEGDDTNCFVSLVVDTRGQYVAIVTRKVQRKEKITITSLGESYEFFGEGSKELTKEGFSTTENVIDKTYIEYFDLKVERHEVQNDLSYLDDRFEEIERKKHADLSKQAKFGRKEDIIDSNKGFLDWLHKDKKKLPVEQNLFTDAPESLIKETFMAEDEEMLREVAAWQPDAKKIHKAVCNIITCNLIINPDKFDLKQWVARHMENMYKKIFGGDFNVPNAFNEWRDFIIQFTLDNFDTSDVPESMLDDLELFQSRVATAIIGELDKYSKGNEYIHSYCELLEQYVVEE